MALGAQLREAREARKLTASQVAVATNMKVQIVEDLEQEDFHRVAAPIYGKGFIRLYAEHVGLDPKPLIEDYMLLISPDRPSLSTGDRDGDQSPSRPHLTRRVRARLAPNRESAENAAPAPPPPADEVEEPDLFEAATVRRRERAIVDESVPPVVAERGGKRVHAAPHGIRMAIPALRALVQAAADATRRAFRAVRVAGVRAADRAHERLAIMHFGDAPLKTIAVAIGVAVLLLFVVSVMSRCVHVRSHAADDAFPMAIDVPEPYFE